ncbi:hypothetical protein IWX47DRAFT_849172 [Phyllosticta citricarpa]
MDDTLTAPRTVTSRFESITGIVCHNLDANGATVVGRLEKALESAAFADNLKEAIRPTTASRVFRHLKVTSLTVIDTCGHMVHMSNSFALVNPRLTVLLNNSGGGQDLSCEGVACQCEMPSPYLTAHQPLSQLITSKASLNRIRPMKYLVESKDYIRQLLGTIAKQLIGPSPIPPAMKEIWNSERKLGKDFANPPLLPQIDKLVAELTSDVKNFIVIDALDNLNISRQNLMITSRVSWGLKGLAELKISANGDGVEKFVAQRIEHYEELKQHTEDTIGLKEEIQFMVKARVN